MPPPCGGAPGGQKVLPAVAVGGAVLYVASNFVSLGTVGLVGIGAGVGYGVGSWVSEKLRGKRCELAMKKLAPQVQVALKQWQAFLEQRLPGRQPNPAEAEALFAEFAQLQPSNAEQVRGFVHAHGGSTVGGAAAMAPGAHV
uniref:Uncharacterized protein n=1 Tax=Zooxanthella nutricula TaxID=1333877 RepID=A0A6U6QQX3_9DINO|mmetsp:Transcript_68066/g.208684  ORF Transcript_68066/g.208684 Transcript_68066/m.208684 type:complete len:142 (+) Transcript_68066:66-491(+)